MQYKAFKDTLMLSRLGMGNMRLPIVNNQPGEIDYPAAKALIDRCIALGVNYFDTAYGYHEGMSEEFLGRALADYPRDSFYVADKFNFQMDPDYRAQFAQQRQRLNMDCIDFYLLHGIQDHFLEAILECGCIPYFDQMKKEGKIRYFGFSYHGSPEQLPRLLAAYPWDFAMIQLNYYDWYFGDGQALYDILTQHHIPVMVMEPAHGGLLTQLVPQAQQVLQAAAPGRSQASYAMRFVQDLPGVLVVLSGMSTLEQLEDNAAVFDENLPLSQAEAAALRQAADVQKAALTVSCTACRYCCHDCPQGLDIAMMLAVYNRVRVEGAWRLAPLKELPEDKKPSACVGCGVCIGHCPQSLDIPALMRELTGMLTPAQAD